MPLPRAPFLDLFDRLREAGMALTYPQYEQFNKALFLAELSSCDDPWKRVKSYGCWLWVKPSSRFDQVTYERVFEQYRQSYQGKLLELFQGSELESKQDAQMPSVRFQTGKLPVVPPKIDESESELLKTKDDPAGEVVSAVRFAERSQSFPQSYGFILKSQDLPITGTQLVEYWQVTRMDPRHRGTRRLDLIQFRRRLIRSFPDYEICYQVQRQQAENLVLLIDTALGIRPFLPWVESLISGIESDLMSSGHIFYFLHFPKNVLYPKSNPTCGIGFDTDQLSALFHSQTTVLIVSDAGTVRREDFSERSEGMNQFLSFMASKVASIVTLNPMPRALWKGTCADVLKDSSEHQMLSINDLTLERMEQIFRLRSLMEVR